MHTISPRHGARNLLLNCAGAQKGEHLLIAYEPPEFGYFDPGAAECVASEAKALGLSVTLRDVGFSPDRPHLDDRLRGEMDAADIVIFLARLGDQLRFRDMPPDKRIIVSFALNPELFGSGFAKAHHAGLEDIKDRINMALATARHVRLTCPAGTEVSGRPEMDLDPSGDTTVTRFPLSIHTPVPAHSFSGRVALPGFLTGTGSRYYENYTVEFDGPVAALMREGRLTGFEGSEADVARANAHYDRVSHLFDIDRDAVHSWHAGIHPGCGFPWPMRGNYERWGGAAFGNPRILHFHTCGTYAPGEISWNVIDPTIEIDGVEVWRDGAFHLDRLPGGQDILDGYPGIAALFEAPDRRIGLGPPS
ncbi:hypothetical protein SAMN05444007_10553 [Cribrihabitans marinus]|uniref:Uncharacterized protein n=1 Tax=Cribrihabitans marinus TaxID=1227549 RepID=A0A1H6ZBM5_9RHOB|nr:hypothetical protein [Cribrihabitans marinus]GGH31174.1 hypothetical protein GCM10010973_21840 [Cribrihabitans marinus]SEJ49454.1 hypothetical protein SAMN05444007_10553 [Cribrihabitans marinus]